MDKITNQLIFIHGRVKIYIKSLCVEDGILVKILALSWFSLLLKKFSSTVISFQTQSHGLQKWKIQVEWVIGRGKLIHFHDAIMNLSRFDPTARRLNSCTPSVCHKNPDHFSSHSISRIRCALVTVVWGTWSEWKRHGGQSQAGQKGCQLDLGTRRAPRYQNSFKIVDLDQRLGSLQGFLVFKLV